MRAINEDDVKRLIRSEKRNFVLTQFPGVTEALNHVEGGLVGVRTVESPMPRWISVEERLPEDGESVLVRIRLCDATWYEVAHRINGRWSTTCITHWMPIPQPPKEG